MKKKDFLVACLMFNTNNMMTILEESFFEYINDES